MSNSQLKLSVVLNAVDRMTGPLRAATGSNRELAKAVRETQSTIKGLDAQQKLIDRFRSTNKGIGIKTREWEEAQARVQQIRKEMEATPFASAKMQKAFDQATATAKNLKASINQLSETKQRLRDELAATRIDTKRLSASQTELKSRVAAANATLADQRAKLQAASDRMNVYQQSVRRANQLRAVQGRIASAGAATAAAGAAVTAVGMAPVKAYAEAEDAATQLKVAMMQANGQTAESFSQIDALANQLGNRLPGTTADYQNMMTMLIRQGMSAQAILGGLGEATAYLAVQLKMPTEQAAEFASKLQDATRTSEKDMMGLMDTIQRTFYLGVDSNNMLDAFAKLSPSLSIIKKTGLEAADALAPLIVMADQAGMRGEAAGNAYRKIFQYTMDAKKLGKANAALGGTGIRLDFSNGKGEFGGLDQLFANLQKLRGLSTMKRGSVIKELFGDDAETLQAVSLMIDKGKAGYEEVQAKMANQANIQQRVNQQLATLKNLWDAASGTFTNALVAFGESISPELHATATWIGDVSQRIQSWAKENPQLAGSLMTIIKWAGILLTVFGGIALAVAAILGPFALMITTLGALGIALPTVGAMLAGLSGGLIMLWNLIRANPIVLLVSLIGGGLVGAIATLISKWDEIVEKFRQGNLWEIGKMLIQGFIDGIDSATFGLLSKATEIVKSVIGVFKSGLGINSPSRVFAEFGGYTMDGFSVGLANAQQGAADAMKRAMAGIAAAGTIAISAPVIAAPDVPNIPAVPMASSLPQTTAQQPNQINQLMSAWPAVNIAQVPNGIQQATSGQTDAAIQAPAPITPLQPIRPAGQSSVVNQGDTYQISIHPTPGMDERAIADMVMREIDARERRKGVVARSSLRDTD